MCGIAGIFSLTDLNGDEINPMINSLHHRGPDAKGYLQSASKNVIFGHTRLSIIDLTDGGSQPMRSLSERYILTYNGEIYNFKNLKEKLLITERKLKFRGQSDTEVLLNYIEIFGIEKTLEDIEGMYAFALWDEKERSLILARDRAGEKPLYYGLHEGVLYFSSELKSIKSKFNNLEICVDAIRLLLKYNCIPAPKTIYRNFYKLEPSTYLKFTNPHNQPEIKKYYQQPHNNYDTNFKSDDHAINAFEGLMNNAVRSQMVSDVPLGSFLSGGVDSSLVTALMQKNSNNPIKTYSIGFDNKSYDEAPFAKQISKAIGTEHNELYLKDKEMTDLIYDLPNIYCEPFSDSSQIPTYFVSKFASDSVSVALTGDAADELFGGYNRYLFAHKYWDNINSMPYGTRKIISNILTKIPSNKITSYGSFMLKILHKKIPSDLGGKVHKFAKAMKARDLNELYDINTSHWNEHSSIYNNKNFDMPWLYRSYIDDIKDSNDMMRADFHGYLHDDNLCKVDRAAMSVSLETRVPFLDKNVINFASSLPFEYKIRNNNTKWILKEALFKNVPKSLFDRPKAGFAIPIHEWMRSDLKEWINHLIFDLNFVDSEVLNSYQIQKIWKQFLNGDNTYTYHLWDIIMLKAWMERHNT